jgi:hypothetical protein
MSNLDQSGGPDEEAISRLNTLLGRQPTNITRDRLDHFLEEAAIAAVNSIGKDIRDLYCETERQVYAPSYCKNPIWSKALEIFLARNTLLHEKIRGNKRTFIKKLGV